MAMQHTTRPHVARAIGTGRRAFCGQLDLDALPTEPYEPDEGELLPNRIAWLQGAEGLSRADLAERFGVTSATVREWERGEREIPDEYALALSDLFGASVPWLLKLEDD
jgi:plasmid maintenance system antidote protein VapI